MHVGMRVIRDEHRTLAAVVDGLARLARDMAEGGLAADFGLMEAIVAYIEGFPARLHHPKEDAVLFPAVQRRTRELDAVIAELRDQHDEDLHRVAALRGHLERWRAAPRDAGAASAFAAAADGYARFTTHHIGVEESRIVHALPALLTAEDWAEVDRAFETNEDPLSHRPLTDPQTAGDVVPLFERIVRQAPAPLGLGDPGR